MADVAAERGLHRARGAAAHPLDLRVRRHRRARGDAAAPRHGRGRRRRHHRGGDRARHRARVLAASRLRGRLDRRHHRPRVPEGPRAPGPRRRGRQPGAHRGAPGDLRARAEAGGGAAARDAHQAVPHGDRHRRARRHRRVWSPSRTCSRRSSARSPTSTTSRCPAVERLPDGSLRVPGRTPVDEVSEELGTELPDEEWDTVGGLILNLLGHVPDEGETVRFQGLEFRTERVQGRRIGVGAHHPASPTPRPTAPDAGRRTKPPSARRPRDVPLGLRLARRSAQRREVDAGEPTRRRQGRDRLRPAADHAHADPRRAHHARRRSSCCSTRPASTSRARCSASAPTSRARSTLAEVDVVCLLIEATGPIGPGDRFVAGLVQQVDTPKILVVSKTDLVAERRGRRAAGRGGRRSSASSTRTCRCRGSDRRRRRRADRRARGAAARRAGVLPGRCGQRPARDLPRGRAGAREAAARRARRAAALHHRGRGGARARARPTTCSATR